MKRIFIIIILMCICIPDLAGNEELVTADANDSSNRYKWNGAGIIYLLYISQVNKFHPFFQCNPFCQIYGFFWRWRSILHLIKREEPAEM